jgi:hypothetical protein
MARIPLAIFAIAFAVSTSQAEQYRYVYWQSEGPTQWDIAADVTALYLRLQEEGLLQTREVIDHEGRPVLQILRDEGLWFGEGFTKPLDELLCGINPHVCSLGEEVRWTNGPGSVIRVPDLHFEVYSTVSRYQKSAGESVANAVVEKRRGCIEFDTECRTAIENLNSRRGDVLAAEFEGEVIVPNFAVRTQIDLAPEAAGHEEHPEVPDLRVGAERPEDDAEEGELENPTVEEVKGLQRKSRNDRAIRNTIPRVEFERHSEHDAPEPEPPVAKCAALEEARKKLLSLIQHPGDDPGPHPIAVAVIDGWTDVKHCDFKELTVHAEDPTAPEEFERAKCKDCEVGTFIKPNDHATHVAAIIATIVRGPDGELDGATPEVVILEVDDSNPFYTRRVSEVIGEAMRKRIDVFNISASYRVVSTLGGEDPVERKMSEFHDNKLFVVAAGNAKRDLSAGCSVFPACFELPNVLNVIALDEDPDAPEPLKMDSRGSNYGMKTHVGAPGHDVLSALHGDRYGRASGTSQATPIVSGAAALLLASDPKLRPEEVKERLIYTCDLPESLRGKVLGGRINLTRALDHRDNLIRFEKGGEEIQTKGQMSYRDLWYREFEDMETDKAVSWSKVLRLRRDPGGVTYTLFLKGRNGVPLRKDRVRLLPTSNDPMLLVAAGPPQQLQPTDIIDYVARTGP